MIYNRSKGVIISSLTPPLSPLDDITKLAKPKIEEANQPHSLLTLIGTNISWVGKKIDSFFGGWISRCYSYLFKSKEKIHEVELENMAKNDGLDETPIDECFSADEIDEIATLDATPFKGERVLIKRIYGYRIVEIDSVEDDDVVLKNLFFETEIHIKRNDIRNF